MKAPPPRFHRILLHQTLLLLLITFVGAQPPPPGNDYPYAKFSPSMAIIIVVLIAALFLMGFFSIYIRHCSDSSAAAGSIRRAISMRRRGGAPRGLDASVLETFPTFTYAEVKDHKIGKSALECAVCLNEFEDHETLRLIPKCDHVFHPECVDVWLESHVTCPVCRANLIPQPVDDEVQLSEPAAAADGNIIVDRSNSRTGEIAIQVEENQQQVVELEADDTNRNRNQSFDFPTRPPRSWSVRTGKVLGLSKFRSHSTGHSLVRPGENLDRFTLRLPEVMRKEMMDRAILTRTGSYAATLPRERSSRRGLRNGGGEVSGRVGRLYLKVDKPEPEAKSDRWAFFSRGLSMRSPKVVSETGESSGSSGPPMMKMPSFKCLEPKTADETGLMSEDRNKSPV